MRKNYLLALILFICLSSLNSFAQDVYSALTAHDGYWLLYSERVEQNNNGEYLAKEIYVPENSMDAVMFDTNGQYNMISAINGFSQAEYKWKLIDDKQIKLVDDNGSSILLDIMEISDNILRLKITEDHGNDLKMVKISTYCFPDTRLSAEETNQENQKGVFEINGFSTVPDKIFNNNDSPYRRLSDDKETLSIYNPSETSSIIAQLALYNMFIFDDLGAPPFDINELFNFNMVGVKQVETKNEDKVSKLGFNKKGMLTSVQKLNEETNSIDQIDIEYDKEGEYPLLISYSWRNKKTEIFMKDNWIFINDPDWMLYYEYIKESEKFRLIKSRYYNDDTAESIETKIYDPQTKTLDSYEYFSGTGEYNEDRYKYVYGSDKNKYSIIQSLDTYKTYDYYDIEKSASSVQLKMGNISQQDHEDNEEKPAKYEKEEMSLCKFILNSSGNLQAIEYYSVSGVDDKGNTKYEKTVSIPYTYEYY